MSKLFFYDLETTGTDPRIHSIHQLSGTFVIPGVGEQSVNLNFQPNPYAQIDDAALEVSGKNRQILASYPLTFANAYITLVELLKCFVDKYDKKDKIFLVGYNNAKFDDNFLRAMFEQMGDVYFGSWFWGTSIDVVSLATNRLQDVRHHMEDFKLKTVAKQLGIEVDESKLHDASYDIYLTRQMFNMLK